MTDSSLLDDTPPIAGHGHWDGIKRAYIPDDALAVHPSLKLHSTVAEDVDPVTYEVVRYSLLNINLVHSALLQKLAVSQLIILARDYQTAMMTEDGEMLFVGPGVQYFANTAALGVKYTIEHRSDNPGIKPLDMFMFNDPWIGAPHQQDATIAAPVFVGDELLCWVTNTLHYVDVGGNEPGSFSHFAEDTWQEGMDWPPIKIVEGGQLRVDVEHVFVRQSRLPMLVGMDLRAAIAANEHSRQSVMEVADRYGADVVKTVMRGTLDAGQRLFVKRLQAIPDGRWSHRFYAEGALPGDSGIHRMQVNLTKQHERLVVDNVGTDPQLGSICITFGAFAGGVLAGIMGQMVPDLAGAFGGAYRQIEFRPQSGTITCAEHPAPVSPTPFTLTSVINAVAIAAAKMLSSGDESARDLILGAQWATSGGTFGIAGEDQSGNPFVIHPAEAMLGSFGGSPTKDGADFGGHWWIPGGIGPNVEDLEARAPTLFLYRRALAEGLDGAGRHRGGLGFCYGMALRGIRRGVLLYGFGEAFPKGAGILGAAPGSRSRITIVSDSDVFSRLKSGVVPSSVAELKGESPRELPSKTANQPIADGDVIEGVFPTVAGYGDPLRREYAGVLADVREGRLDVATALRVYGVIVVGNTVDEVATVQARLGARRSRLGGTEPSEPVEPPDGARQVGDLLHAFAGRWWCNGADLGPVDETYKTRAAQRERAMRLIGPEFQTPFIDVADRVIFHEFICPVTGYLIDAEVRLSDESPLDDIVLQP